MTDDHKGGTRTGGRMKAKGMIFQDWSIRAILDGTKTQTRRVIKPQPNGVKDDDGYPVWSWGGMRIGPEVALRNALIQRPRSVGSYIYVRETWTEGYTYGGGDSVMWYRADGECWFRSEPVRCTYAGVPMNVRWRPSTNMPRTAARILLRVTDVRPERLQDISDDDAQAEGMVALFYDGIGEPPDTPRAQFADAWDAINAARGYPWADDPWTWAYTFKPVATTHTDTQEHESMQEVA